MMKSQYVPIELPNQLPFRVRTVQGKSIGRHWHSSIEIVLIVSGKITFCVEDSFYKLEKNDLLLVNLEAHHEVLSEDGYLISTMQIPFEFLANELGKFYPDIQEMQFNLRPENMDKHKLKKLRNVYVDIVNTYESEDKGHHLKAMSLMYELIHLLVTDWQTHTKIIAKSNIKNKSISKIVGFVNENYRNRITLNDVANYAGYSVQYISKMFKQNMGMTFGEYLSFIRVENAFQDLLFTDKSITYISEDNGFSNIKYFIKVFKDRYAITPRDFRKNRMKFRNLSSPIQGVVTHEKEMLGYDILNSVRLPDDISQNNTIGRFLRNIEIKNFHQVNCGNKGIPLNHTWKQIICVKEASDLLLGPVQEQISDIKKDLGIKHVYIKGLMDHPFMQKDSLHDDQYVKFIYIDMIIRFLLKLNIKPWIEFSYYYPHVEFMKNDENRSQIIMNDIQKGYAAVKRLMEHFISIYGKDEVKKWRFSIYTNEIMNIESFPLNFFDYAHKTIKNIDDRISVGKVHVLDHHTIEEEIIHKPFDFLIIHSSEEEILEREMTNLVDKMNQSNMEVFGLVYNDKIVQRDYKNDSYFRASNIITKIISNVHKGITVTYWNVVDSLKNKFNHHIFVGDTGLITSNGIKKATYYALGLLNDMGDTEIYFQDGCIITRRGMDYQLLLYQYDSGIEVEKKYSRHIISMNNIEMGAYCITDKVINEEYGCSYEKWMDMSSPNKFDENMINYLNNISVPKRQITEIKVIDTLSIERTVKPNEIRMIEVVYKH